MKSSKNRESGWIDEDVGTVLCNIVYTQSRRILSDQPDARTPTTILSPKVALASRYHRTLTNHHISMLHAHSKAGLIL